MGFDATGYVNMRVLIVDDEPNIRRTSADGGASGHSVAESSSASEALRVVEGAPCDVALVDLRLGEESGLDLMESLLGQLPGLAIVVITAYASIDTAVEAMRRGAFDYLPKPFTPAQVRAVLERAARLKGLRVGSPSSKDQVRPRGARRSNYEDAIRRCSGSSILADGSPRPMPPS